MKVWSKAMQTIVQQAFRTNLQACEQALISAEVTLRSDGVIALPTDTVYGLACRAQSSTAIQRVYHIKRRAAQKPLAICVANVIDLYRWVHVPVPESLLHELLPGPVTLVFTRQSALNPLLNPRLVRVGVRIPDHAFVRQLCERLDEPLALTSANLSDSGATSSTHEFRDLWPLVDRVFDGGCLGDVDPERLGSTVIDLSVPDHFTIIRDGCALKRVLQVMHKNGLKPLSPSSLS
jgi:tRNA threonylcarbamoyl adenosine modification protein (Sua5/YciO/YrdC/YwlC family)